MNRTLGRRDSEHRQPVPSNEMDVSRASKNVSRTAVDVPPDGLQISSSKQSEQRARALAGARVYGRANAPITGPKLLPAAGANPKRARTHPLGPDATAGGEPIAAVIAAHVPTRPAPQQHHRPGHAHQSDQTLAWLPCDNAFRRVNNSQASLQTRQPANPTNPHPHHQPPKLANQLASRRWQLGNRPLGELGIPSPSIANPTSPQSTHCCPRAAPEVDATRKRVALPAPAVHNN